MMQKLRKRTKIGLFSEFFCSMVSAPVMPFSMVSGVPLGCAIPILSVVTGIVAVFLHIAASRIGAVPGSTVVAASVAVVIDETFLHGSGRLRRSHRAHSGCQSRRQREDQQQSHPFFHPISPFRCPSAPDLPQTPGSSHGSERCRHRQWAAQCGHTTQPWRAPARRDGWCPPHQGRSKSP